MLCRNCGRTIQDGASFCHGCGTPVDSMPTGGPDPASLFKPADHFSFAGDLGSADTDNPVSDIPLDDTHIYTCAVCNTKNKTTLCHNCGFDASCNYEQYPTLQHLNAQTNAISHWKAQRKGSGVVPSVARAMAALRFQGWEEHVLSAVEEILNSAVEDLLAKQQPIKTRPVHRRSEEIVAPVLPKLSQFCQKCGASNNHGTLYCCGCGTKLNTYMPKRAEPKPAAPKLQSATSLQLSRFCGCCGTPVLGGSIYCTTCGSKIG